MHRGLIGPGLSEGEYIGVGQRPAGGRFEALPPPHYQSQFNPWQCICANVISVSWPAIDVCYNPLFFSVQEYGESKTSNPDLPDLDSLDHPEKKRCVDGPYHD